MAFNCDLIFSYSNQREYVGAFNFSNKIVMKVQRVFDATASSGESPTGVPALITGVFTGVIVNGINFGSGRVVSFGNPVSADITENGRHLWKQVVDVEVYTTGDSSNSGTNSIYSGFTGLYHPQFDSLDESFSFELPDDGGYRYSHSVSVRCYNEPSGAGVSGYITAQRMASGLLATTPPIGYIDAVHSGFYTGLGRRLYQEKIDKLNGTVDCEETLEIQARDFIRHSVSFDGGFINITENGLIRHSGVSLANTAFTDDPQALMTRYTNLYNGAWTRCNGIWKAYSGLMGQDAYMYDLAVQPAQLTKVFDENAQELTYSVVYTNNPQMTTSGYSIERDIAFSLSQEGITDITENGQITAYANKNAGAKTTLLTAINAQISGALPRMSDLWASASTNKKVSEQKTFSNIGKKAGYSVSYTNDPAFINDGTFLTKTISIQDNGAVLMHSPYFIVGKASPLVHNPGQTQFGNASCTISAALVRPTNYTPITPQKPEAALTIMFSGALNTILPLVASYAPIDVFVSQLSYVYNSNFTAELTAEVQYIYARQNKI